MADPSPSSSSSFSGSFADEDNLIKGFAFDVLRLYLIANFKPLLVEETFETLPRRTREILDEPDINEWYSESEMRRLIHIVYEDFAKRNDERFMEIMRGVAADGIGRFYRTIFNLASGRFVLRNIPTFWKRLRSGPAKLHTEQLDDGRVLVHYDNFRYCRDPIYRMVSIANCQACAFAATKKLPKGSLVRHTASSMTLGFELDE